MSSWISSPSILQFNPCPSLKLKRLKIILPSLFHILIYDQDFPLFILNTFYFIQISSFPFSISGKLVYLTFFIICPKIFYYKRRKSFKSKRTEDTLLPKKHTPKEIQESKTSQSLHISQINPSKISISTAK